MQRRISRLVKAMSYDELAEKVRNDFQDQLNNYPMDNPKDLIDVVISQNAQNFPDDIPFHEVSQKLRNMIKTDFASEFSPANDVEFNNNPDPFDFEGWE